MPNSGTDAIGFLDIGASASRGRSGTLKLPSSRTIRVGRATLIALGLSCMLLSGCYTLLGVGRPEWGWLFNHVIFDATYFVGAASSFLRAAERDDDRRVWSLLGASMLTTGASSVFFSLGDLVPGAAPVSATLRLLSFLPLLASMVYLVRYVTGITERRFLFDAAILAVGLIAAVVVVLSLNMSIPIGLIGPGAIGSAVLDVAVGAVAFCALLESGRHPVLVVTSCGLLCTVVADVAYAVREHNGTYVPGTALDQLWQLAAFLAVIAPWVEASRPRGQARHLDVIIGPLVSIGIAAAIAALVLPLQLSGPVRLLASTGVAVCVGAGLLRVVFGVRRLTSRLALASSAAAALAHELRQPVTAARNAVAQLLPSAAAEEAVTLRLVDDQLQSIASRANVVQPAAVPDSRGQALEAIVRQAVRGLSILPGAISIFVDPRYRVKIDPEVAETVIRNLVANALEHGGPPVRIRAEGHRDRIDLVVEDSGSGIALQPPATAFDIGVSRHEDDDRGLGLALARALARAAGGDVRYSPKGTCRGRFVVRLPHGES